MTPCEQLSDRIPEVIAGRSRWSEAEAAHLARCADCRAEVTLLRAAAGIGAGAPAPRDPAVVAEAVLRRLADDRRSRSRSAWRWVAGAAAAAGIGLATWAGVRGGLPAPAAPPVIEIALPELEPLETAELDSLLETMDAAPTGWSAMDEPTLNDLNSDELELVLRTWEG
jgi:hypothetical protein